MTPRGSISSDTETSLPPDGAAGDEGAVGGFDDQVKGRVIQAGTPEGVEVLGGEAARQAGGHGDGSRPGQGGGPPGRPVHLDPGVLLTLSQSRDPVTVGQRRKPVDRAVTHAIDGRLVGIGPEASAKKRDPGGSSPSKTGALR